MRKIRGNTVGTTMSPEKIAELIGGGGGITDEELAEKVEEIIIADFDEAGSIYEVTENLAATTAFWASERAMEQLDLALWDGDNEEYIRNVPTYEELEETLNGYVDWEGLHIELDGALECYPNYDELYEATQEKPYELIQSFTLTETTKTVELSGFELDKFVLYIYSPIYTSDSGCRVQVYKGEEQVFNQWVNNILRKDKNNTSAFFGRNESGLAFIEYAAMTSDYKYLTTVPGYIEGINPFTKINLIMSAADFLAETKFELWGVRR